MTMYINHESNLFQGGHDALLVTTALLIHTFHGESKQHKPT